MKAATAFLLEGAAQISPLSPPDADLVLLEIAGINAAVLAILFAAVFAYAVIVVQEYNAMATDMIEAARKINRLKYGGRFGKPCLDPDEDDQVPGLLIRVIDLARENRGPLDPQTDLPPLNAVEERANQALEILSELCGRYPLPRKGWHPADTPGDTALLFGPYAPGKPVKLDTYDEVVRWLSSVKHYLGNLSVPLFGCAELSHLFRQASELHWAAPAFASSSPTGRQLLEVYDAAQNFESIRSFIPEAQAVVAETEFLMGKIQAYRIRLSRLRLPIAIALSSLSVAFLAGVILPLAVAMDSKNWWAISVPCAAYIGLLGTGTYVVMSRLRRSTTREK